MFCHWVAEALEVMLADYTLHARVTAVQPPATDIAAVTSGCECIAMFIGN